MFLTQNILNNTKIVGLIIRWLIILKSVLLLKTLISTKWFYSLWSFVTTILQSDICQLNVFNEFKEAETFVLVTKSGPRPNPDPKPWSGTHFPNTILRLLEFSGLASRFPSSISSLFSLHSSISPSYPSLYLSLPLSVSSMGFAVAESFKLWLCTRNGKKVHCCWTKR